MKDAHFMRFPARSAVASAALAATLWLIPAPGTLLRAQQTAPDSKIATNSAHAVSLEYRELAYPVLNYPLPFSAQSAAFAKEPNAGQRQVVRGTLKFGNGTEHFVPFLWDYTQSRLYLDLNRNHDLTDDAEGVFTNWNRSYGRNYYYQTFTNIHLAFKTPLGIHRSLVDLHLHSYDNHPGGSIECRSFWEGKITLNGQDWQLGFVENVAHKLGSTEDSYLLLRPWADRQQSFSLNFGSLSGFRFQRNLFFAQQAYRVNCAYVQQGDVPGFKIDFQEQRAELGELKVTGKFIERLLLTGQGGKQPFTVVLDNPEPLVKIPVGSYSPEVHLKQGKTEAYREANRSPSPSPKFGGSLSVGSGKRAVVEIGGPLTNMVSIRGEGRDLIFDYKLVGACGQVYQLQGVRREPEFVVYRGDKKVATGKFEFG